MLFPHSIDPAAYSEILGIVDLVGRYKKWADRQKTIQHLSSHPLARRKLRSARGEIIGAAVSGHIPKRLTLRYVSCFTTNNDRKFRLVVIPVVNSRQEDIFTVCS
jgi:hypothetical protein